MRKDPLPKYLTPSRPKTKQEFLDEIPVKAMYNLAFLSQTLKIDERRLRKMFKWHKRGGRYFITRSQLEYLVQSHVKPCPYCGYVFLDPTRYKTIPHCPFCKIPHQKTITQNRCPVCNSPIPRTKRYCDECSNLVKFFENY